MKLHNKSNHFEHQEIAANRLAGILTALVLTLFLSVVAPFQTRAAGTHLDRTFLGKGKINFGFGSMNSDDAHAVAIQPDGKIVVVGRTYSTAGGQDFAIARLKTDGTPDSTFDGDGLLTVDFGGASDFALAVAIQTDGKIVVAGEANATGGGGNIAIVRVTDTGIPDSTFDNDGKATFDFDGGDDSAYAIALQPDGKILLAGRTIGSHGIDWAVLRLTTGGGPDQTFGTNGRVVTDFSGSNNAAAGIVVL